MSPCSQLFTSLSELQRERSPRRSEETNGEANESLRDMSSRPEGRVVADLVGAMREGRLSKTEVGLCTRWQAPSDVNTLRS